MKVSVILPVYNAEKYLRDAVDSILAQTFRDFELIIINDGSTDGSRQIIDSYNDDRIVKVDNDGNRGLIYTLNRGVELSKGIYIARMDSDDVSLPRRFEEQVKFLNRHPSIGFLGANGYFIDKDSKPFKLQTHTLSPRFTKTSLLFTATYMHPVMMIRRDLLVENPYREHFKHIEDFDLWERLSQYNNGANLKKPLLLYRMHGDNISLINHNNSSTLQIEILNRQLDRLGLHIDNLAELEIHRSSFVGSDIDLLKLRDWFNKIIEANYIKRIYDDTSFIAFLYFRWVVACFKMKNYTFLFKSGLSVWKRPVACYYVVRLAFERYYPLKKKVLK